MWSLLYFFDYFCNAVLHFVKARSDSYNDGPQPRAVQNNNEENLTQKMTPSAVRGQIVSGTEIAK
ncbi:unnamed protein product [Acanthoscelides obtectus]|nr:unnamed protein product [Acanthoscelides obtectus]CAK1676376.1 hypothetical protein AOBTE_LOCUS30716 [Acanthoscelides obtectus]